MLALFSKNNRCVNAARRVSSGQVKRTALYSMLIVA